MVVVVVCPPELVYAFTKPGEVVDAATLPYEVIVPGATAAAVAELEDWQQSNFVFVTLVNSSLGGVNVDV